MAKQLRDHPIRLLVESSIEQLQQVHNYYVNTTLTPQVSFDWLAHLDGQESPRRCNTLVSITNNETIINVINRFNQYQPNHSFIIIDIINNCLSIVLVHCW
jgi:hypothetical protein